LICKGTECGEADDLQAIGRPDVLDPDFDCAFIIVAFLGNPIKFNLELGLRLAFGITSTFAVEEAAAESDAAAAA
jgi:hypothetical protein